MSLFDVFDNLPDDPLPDRNAPKLTTITGTFLMSPEDARALLNLPPIPKRIYPCRHCSNNYSVVPTGNPASPYRMVCDPCGLPTNDCTCERIPYANVP